MQYRDSTRCYLNLRKQRSGGSLAVRSSGRVAYTLVELLLVVAIVVMVASLSVGYITRSFSGHNLKKGADLVRAEFGKARARTMRTGEIHAFFFVPGSNQFTVGKYSDRESISMTDNTQIGMAGQYQFFNQLLPPDVTFAASDVLADSQAVFVESQFESSGSNDFQRVLFYGDGSSQNAKLTLRHANGTAVQVTLRGLTGVAAVSKIFSPEG